jgi:hypothetical protein
MGVWCTGSHFCGLCKQRVLSKPVLACWDSSALFRFQEVVSVDPCGEVRHRSGVSAITQWNSGLVTYETRERAAAANAMAVTLAEVNILKK